MNTGFYRKQNLLPIIMSSNGHKEYQHEMIRPSGMPELAQVSMCVCGEGEFTDDSGRTYRIREGDIFYFMPDTPHSYRNITEKWSVRYILIGGSGAPEFMRSLGYLRSGVLHPDRETFKKLIDIWQAVDVTHKDRLNPELIAEFSLICYKTVVSLRHFLFDETAEKRTRSYNRIIPVISVIESQFGSDLPLEYLSGLIGVTPTYLCRLFRNSLNMSPTAYISKVRMDRAREFLRERRNMQIRDIAAECGFESAGYFGKVFKRTFGITPEGYRMSGVYK